MAKRRTSDLYSISTQFLRQYFGIEGNGTMRVDGKPIASLFCSEHSLRVMYALTDWSGTRTEVDTEILLEWTPCHYGGMRRWFRCPSCGERCGVIYMGKQIACRKCWNMLYPSQADRQERGWTRYHRLMRKTENGKPLRMRWNTYYRILDEQDRIATRQCLPLLRRLKHGKG